MTGIERKYTVWELSQDLYGLRQTLRRWNTKSDSIVKNLRLFCSPDIPCFYAKWKDDRDAVIIALHVDDLLLAGNYINANNWWK